MRNLKASVVARSLAVLFLSSQPGFSAQLAPPVNATIHALPLITDAVGCSYRIVSHQTGLTLSGGAELIDATRWESILPADILHESYDSKTGLLTSLALGWQWVGDFSANSNLKLVRQTTRVESAAMIEKSEVIFELSFNPKKDAQIIEPISDSMYFVMDCISLGNKESDARAEFLRDHNWKSAASDRQIQLTGFSAQGFKKDYGQKVRAQFEKKFGQRDYLLSGNEKYHWMALNLEVSKSQTSSKEKCGFLNLSTCVRDYDVCTVHAKVDGPFIPHLRGTHTFTSQVRKAPEPKDNSLANRVPDNTEAMCQGAVDQAVEALIVEL